MRNNRRKNIEKLEPRNMLASDWQNPLLIRDVDGSAMVTPLDAMLVINDLNNNGSRKLPAHAPRPGEFRCDVNGDNWVSPLDALLVINALNTFGLRQPTMVAGLSPGSDPNNNGIVLANQVTLMGQSLAGSVITVAFAGEEASPIGSVVADANGRFSFDMTVAEGLQTVMLTAHDELGRQSEVQLDVRRGNTIQDWNAAALDVVRQWSTFSNDPYTNRIVTAQPPLVARNLAMIHTAMFDAANAVTGQYHGYVVNLLPQTGASANAAAASAGFEVAKTLYNESDEVAVWQASLNETLAQETDTTARDLGVALGKTVAQAILTDRSNDGVKSSSTYKSVNEIGHWQRTFPDYLPPLLSQWPNVKPFVMTSGNEFRPEPPPSLGSPEYAAAVDQVMQLGGYQSAQRTADQTQIALFWADGGGTATPPGHWNSIATDVTLARGTNLVDTARTFALMNIAMADAGIAAWDAKYHYDLWRPIDAIRQADRDNNVATTGNATWIPLLKTPPFPTYTSGHSTFSGAASTVLASLFGDQTSFDSKADGHSASEERPLDPSQITTRHFTSFSQAAEEAGMSRIYGGIHFSFDNTAGLDMGRQIGTATITRIFH